MIGSARLGGDGASLLPADTRAVRRASGIRTSSEVRPVMLQPTALTVRIIPAYPPRQRWVPDAPAYEPRHAMDYCDTHFSRDCVKSPANRVAVTSRKHAAVGMSRPRSGHLFLRKCAAIKTGDRYAARRRKRAPFYREVTATRLAGLFTQSLTRWVFREYEGARRGS